MITPWTRTEKWLWATPLLLGVVAFAVTRGPEALRRSMGWPQQLATPPNNQLTSVVLARDGSLLAATGYESSPTGSAPSSGTVYLWDARTLRPLKSFLPQRGQPDTLVKGLSLSPDGKLIGMDGRGKPGFSVYEVATQSLLWQITGRRPHAQFSNDGRFVAMGHFELREAHTGKLVSSWKASNGSAQEHFSLSHNAKTVAWIGGTFARRRPVKRPPHTPKPPNGRAVEIRRVSDGKVLRVLPNSQETEAVAFSPDGSRIVSLARGELITSGIDGSIVRCHSLSGQQLWQRDFRYSTQQMAGQRFFSDAIFSPDGKTIALRDATPKNDILLLNAANGSDQKQLTPAKGQNSNYSIPPALAFSPDGKQLFARGQNSVLVWNLE